MELKSQEVAIAVHAQCYSTPSFYSRDTLQRKQKQENSQTPLSPRIQILAQCFTEGG